MLTEGDIGTIDALLVGVNEKINAIINVREDIIALIRIHTDISDETIENNILINAKVKARTAAEELVALLS